MITLRKSNQRGRADYEWLDSRHTFSFGHYYDPAHMGFSVLRVMNEDVVAPGKGFGTHPHDNMEILSYVLEGSLAHKDSMGNGSSVQPGEFQRMSAGTGVTHSEFNPSETEKLHFYQIWILPEAQNIKPSYEQRSFSDRRVGEPRLVVSKTGEHGSIVVHQDVKLYSLLVEDGSSLEVPIESSRSLWVQCLRGAAQVAGHECTAGDGVALSHEAHCAINASTAAELLLFDLP